MKTRLLIIIAVFLVLIPWIKELEFGTNDQVMADGITVSAITVMTTTVVFSIMSWFLFSWASRNIKFTGIPLSVIAGASLVIPFLQVLGPMAGVIVGVVAGFAAFMLQKYTASYAKNKPLIIATATFTLTYVVLTLLILQAQSVSAGIGVWTGTAEGMEKKGFDNIFNNGVEFAFFLITVPSLMVTGLVITSKSLKSRILIIIGTILMIEGFSAIVYSAFFLFSTTEPPMMRSVVGIDYVFFMHRQAFLLSGIVGIFVTVAGIIFWRKRK